MSDQRLDQRKLNMIKVKVIEIEKSRENKSILALGAV